MQSICILLNKKTSLVEDEIVKLQALLHYGSMFSELKPAGYCLIVTPRVGDNFLLVFKSDRHRSQLWFVEGKSY